MVTHEQGEIDGATRNITLQDGRIQTDQTISTGSVIPIKHVIDQEEVICLN